MDTLTHSPQVTALVATLFARLGRIIPITNDNSIVIIQLNHRRFQDVTDYHLCWDPSVYVRADGTNPKCAQLEFSLESPNTLADFIRAYLKRVDGAAFDLDGSLELVIAQTGFFARDREKRL